jgi:hypothetical protein
MKKLFLAIRQKKIDEVSRILDKNPELVNCISEGDPKKDNGQAPLQIAIKTDNYDIAELLINRGADVTFMETESQNEEWRKPVLHFAISAVVHNARSAIYIPKYSSQNKSGFLGLFKKDQWEAKAEPSLNYQNAMKILKLVIDKGAKIDPKDYYGITSVELLCNLIENLQLDRSRPLIQEAIEDLYPIFELIKATKITDFEIPCKRGNSVYHHYRNIIDQIIVVSN